MPANLTYIAVANLWTTERWFDHFEVEMHSDTSGNHRKGVLEIDGVWNDSAARWEQQSLMAFNNAVVGTTYYFRSRVIGKYGNSSWSSWISEVAGDTQAPTSTYTATATRGPGGIEVDVAVTNPASDLDRYEWFYRRNSTDSAPSSSDGPNLLNSHGTSTFITLSGSQDARFWIRAVDTSGNEQPWTYLGAWNSLAQYVFMKNSDTIASIDDGGGYSKTATGFGSENMVQNPVFDAGTAAWPNSGSLVTDTLPNGESGQAIKNTAIGYGYGIRSNTFSLIPGATYIYSGWIKSGGSGSWYLYFGNYSDGAIGSLGAPTAWTYFSKIYTVPSSGGKSNELIGQFTITNASGTSDWAEVWGASVVKVRENNELRFKISSPFNGQGSIVAGGDNGSFSADISPSTITIWNVAGSYPLPDGTSGTFSANGSESSPAWTFSGLTALTQYTFVGYYDINLGETVVLMVSASPTPTWWTQQVYGDGHAVLFTAWQLTTTSSGTSSGGGSIGGGGATCPAVDQILETRERGFIPAGELVVGMHLRGWCGEWNRVLGVKRRRGWLHHVTVGGETYHVDLNHRWLPPGIRPDAPVGKWLVSAALDPGTRLRSADGKTQKVWRVSAPHRGHFVEIRAERQRFRIGALIAHNMFTYWQ